MPILGMYEFIMTNQQSNSISEKDFLAASALVDTALLSFEVKSKVSLHPKLKKRISQEIAKNPVLTKDLFDPNFFNKFLRSLMEEEFYWTISILRLSMLNEWH